MAKQAYDLLVIGAGAAGSSAVTTIDKDGLRTGLVERRLLGGTCLNYGCDPTKTILHIAHLLYHAHHANQFGLRIPQATFDWADVQAFVHQVIDHLRGGTPEEARADLNHKGIARNAFARNPQPFDDRVIPWVTFTDPALAHVGKTEEQLQEEDVKYRVARMPMSENERAITMGETEGLVKLLIDMDGKILGGHILAARGDDLLAPIVQRCTERLSPKAKLSFLA